MSESKSALAAAPSRCAVRCHVDVRAALRPGKERVLLRAIGANEASLKVLTRPVVWRLLPQSSHPRRQPTAIQLSTAQTNTRTDENRNLQNKSNACMIPSCRRSLPLIVARNAVYSQIGMNSAIIRRLQNEFNRQECEDRQGNTTAFCFSWRSWRFIFLEALKVDEINRHEWREFRVHLAADRLKWGSRRWRIRTLNQYHPTPAGGA